MTDFKHVVWYPYNKNVFDSGAGKQIKTVGDLRSLIDGLHDSTHVSFYDENETNTYPLEAAVCEQECISHNGTHYTTNGLIFTLW